MRLPVVLRAEAQAEFDEAFDFYESRRQGSGVAFAARVQEALDRIASNPLLHPCIFADVRKTTVQRVPYRVFYRAEANRVEVIAVYHTSRNPNVWKDRL